MSQNQKFKGTIKDQMRKQDPALLRAAVRPSGIMLHPSSWKGDGEDHINVSSSARTTIGQWLHGRNSNPFNHPLLGHFRSIDNLSFFIRSVNIDDRVRTMENFNMIRQLVEENGGFRPSTPQFKAIMVHSIWLRILDNPALIKEMVESTLPFDSYRINPETKVRQRFEPAAYLCRGYEEIRKALVERRAPNLTQFLDGKRSDQRDVDIYFNIMQILTGSNYAMNAGEIVERYAAERLAKYDQHLIDAAADAERRAAKKRQQRKAAKDRKRAALAREGVVDAVSDSVEDQAMPVEVDGKVSLAGDEEMRLAEVPAVDVTPVQATDDPAPAVKPATGEKSDLYHVSYRALEAGETGVAATAEHGTEVNVSGVNINCGVVEFEIEEVQACIDTDVSAIDIPVVPDAPVVEGVNAAMSDMDNGIATV